MSTNLSKIISPSASSALLNSAFLAVHNALPLGSLFPIDYTDSENVFEYPVEQKISPSYLHYIADDVTTPLMGVEGSLKKHGRVGKLGAGIKLPVNILEKGEKDVYSTLKEYFTILGQRFALTLESKRLQALYTGEVQYNFNDANTITTSISFGRSSDNEVEVATPWDSDTSTPIEDILSALADNPTLDTLLISNDVLDALSRNAQIIKALFPTATTDIQRISYEDVKSVIYSYTSGRVTVKVITDNYRNITIEGKTLDFNVGTVLNITGFAVLYRGSGVGKTYIGKVPEITGAYSYYGLGANFKGFLGYVSDHIDPHGYKAVSLGSAVPILSAPDYTYVFKKVLTTAGE